MLGFEVLVLGFEVLDHLGARVRGFGSVWGWGSRFLLQASRFSFVLELGFEVSGPGSEAFAAQGVQKSREGLKNLSETHSFAFFFCFLPSGRNGV